MRGHNRLVAVLLLLLHVARGVTPQLCVGKQNSAVKADLLWVVDVSESNVSTQAKLTAHPIIYPTRQYDNDVIPIHTILTLSLHKCSGTL